MNPSPTRFAVRPAMSDGHSRSEYFGQVGVPRRLGERFYDVPCEDLAMSLLGKVLVRQLDDGTVVKGRIVETESYPGGEDVASHSFNGRVTTRNEPMFMKPGTAYVYMTYGMYHCFNISSKGNGNKILCNFIENSIYSKNARPFISTGDGAAVLLRSIEPLYNSETMTSLRKKFRKSPNAVIKSKDLCNGPAKLCLSFAIDIKSCNKQDLTSWNGMWVEEDEQSGLADTIVCSPRIGIKCEKEWQDKFLRFYILDSPFVSKLEKTKMSIVKYSQIKN